MLLLIILSRLHTPCSCSKQIRFCTCVRSVRSRTLFGICILALQARTKVGFLETQLDSSCVQLLAQGCQRERNPEMRAHFKGKPEIFLHHFHVEKSLLCFVQNKWTSILSGALRLESNVPKTLLLSVHNELLNLNHGRADGAVAENFNSSLFGNSGTLGQ